MSIGSWWLFLESIMHGGVKAYKKKGKTFAVFPGNTFLFLAAVKQQAEFFFLSGSHSREASAFVMLLHSRLTFQAGRFPLETNSSAVVALIAVQVRG
jgi:hypothetical protein